MAAAAQTSSAGSSGSSVYAVSEQKTNGTRLARLLVDGGTNVFREVLHSIHPPKTLQHVLKNNLRKLQSLKSRRVIFEDEWEKLFPTAGDPPDSQTFDITLLHLLLREICCLTAPPTGWHKMPADGDASVEANIVRIKLLRNKLFHSVTTGIAKDEFEDRWNIVSSALVALGLDRTEVDRLKTEPIDHDTERRVEEEINKWKLEIEPRVESLEDDVLKLKDGMSRIQGSVSDQRTFEPADDIPFGEFEDNRSKISSSFKDLQVSIYEKKIQGLKSDPVDHELNRGLEEKFEQRKTDQVISELCSCLPDKRPEECMFGRTQEIQQIKDYVQSATVAVVLITGGPGFGKTTVANEVAHELAKSDNERTVLFCSLLAQRTFNEAATEMIHSCGTIQTKAPENPEQWLKDWSKQIQTQVTFVLDNADGILESEHRSFFLNILRALRMLSKQKVTFVITTRKTFQDPNLPLREVRLNPVLADEAKRILVSRIYDHDIRNKLCQTERLVELCSGIPLALCIVGSLLFDFTEEKLIKHLEERPLDVLKDDETSVENAIKTSFDLLTQAEHKEAFVLMSVFWGPFNSDAAEAVMEACSIPGTLSGSNLCYLKNRSLLEQPRPRTYQMHPLIQAFAKKIGEAEYPHLVAAGVKLACAHFVSRLAENANMYWSKDSCRESVEAFNADRHNYEYFLQIYSHGITENKDCDIVESCQTFLDDLPQKCMYLEMCVLPRFYISILENLLEMFDPENQPVHRAELLCLLGHEYRKAGKTEKYRELMMEADQVHTKNRAEFVANALSEVYFRNSFVRFLSDKKDPNENERIEEETEAVLQLSRDKLGEHPERAATLLYAGIFEKRRKERGEAEKKFSEAFELFKKCLGKHFMTAQCLKNIADLYFFLQKSESKTELDICLAHYAEVIEMFEDLRMIESKESILTLRNFGICHMRRGNFNEAMTLLTKSGKVAEKELEPHHKWKVWIKTSMAILHDKMGNLDQAKEVMREGLSMGRMLNHRIDGMGNKDEILEFIGRYPEIFPESEFPSK